MISQAISGALQMYILRSICWRRATDLRHHGVGFRVPEL